VTASDEAISIVLADPHRVVRAGLAMLLQAQGDLRVVSEAGDASGACRSVADHRPDVVVLEIAMGEEPCADVISRILDASPATHVVVLTMHDDPGLARDALRAGASGYVLKQEAETELIEAVRMAAAGRTYLSTELEARVAMMAAAAGVPDDLSAREVEVLRLLAVGHTNSEAAAKLFLSVRTIESHRAHIQHKTGRSSRADLVAYAREHGLL
jgi:two-component system response regulator NreC